MTQTKELAPKVITVITVSAFVFLSSVSIGRAQFDGQDIPTDGPPPPTFVPPPPPPTPTPPPVPITPTPVFVPPPVRTPFTPPIVVPTDATQTPSFPGFSPIVTNNGLASPAIRGVQELFLAEFPPQNIKQNKNSKILVFPKSDGENVIYKKLSPSVVDLKEGEILAACRRPSRLGHIKTKFGSIAALANSIVLIRTNSKILRITNTNAAGKRLRVFLNKGPFSGNNKKVMSIKPGYELVVSASRLTRRNMRPSDECLARRHFQVLENGHLAISEISVASIISSSDIIANLRQSTNGTNERRIIGDMSKMAAVLNHMNGTQGFTVSPNTRLAQN